MLQVHRDGGRLRCTLNRPEVRNALHPDLLADLSSAVVEAARAEDVNALVIEGSSGSFSAGFDINVLGSDPATRADGLSRLHETIEQLADCPKLTLAVVSGYCLGAGLDLALACDFRIATPGSTFSIPALRIGTVYRPRSIQRMLRTLGPTTVKELLVAGRRFSAADAMAAGIVQDVVGEDALESAVARWTELPERGRFAAVAHKRIIDTLALGEPSVEVWRSLDDLREQSLESKERSSAVAEFLGRQKA